MCADDVLRQHGSETRYVGKQVFAGGIQVNANLEVAVESEIEEYRNYKISKLDLPAFLPLIFGKAFPAFDKHYYTVINNCFLLFININITKR